MRHILAIFLLTFAYLLPWYTVDSAKQVPVLEVCAWVSHEQILATGLLWDQLVPNAPGKYHLLALLGQFGKGCSWYC